MQLNELKPEDIADGIGVPEGTLWRLAKNMDRAFKLTRMSPERGKLREIDAPYYRPKGVLRRIHCWLSRKIRPRNCVHGGVTGRSYITSARHHLGKRFVVTRDIQDCYPSVTRSMMFDALRRLGCREDTAKLLSMLFTVRRRMEGEGEEHVRTREPRIPQGSPLSPCALNLFLRSVDSAVAASAGRWKASYSRMFDDFVVSTNSRKHADSAGRLLDQCIQEKGLGVSNRKKRKHGLQPCHRQQHVHNLIVNSRRGARVNEDYRATVTRLGDDYVESARRLQPDGVPALAGKRAKLLGHIYNCKQVDFSPAARLQRQLNAGDRLVSRKLVANGLVAYRDRWWVVVYGRGRKIVRNAPGRLKAEWSRLRHRKSRLAS